LFDLVAEVTQACTVRRSGELFDMSGGCTIVIDPQGEIRYAIYKRFDSEERQKRQHAALRGPLRRFWRKSGNRFLLEPDVLGRVHAAARSS
jgi:hypothetical protein